MEPDMLQIERGLERRCIREARRRGWDAWKNEKNGNKGIPDHSLLRNGVFIMVEFKKDAKQKLRDEQVRWRERHNCIYQCSDFDEFINILKENEK